MRKTMLLFGVVLALMAVPAAAQNEQAPASQRASKPEDKTTETAGGPRFIRTLTNVQVELTLTDQLGTAPAEKKTVSMVVSNANWGKIRNTVARIGASPIGLNVDARPFVSIEGQIQLELTIYYYPPQGKPDAPVVPTELNQSLTVVLQSGKPMLVSQAADPASDRKVTVEVKATILK
jgi:hypothetical protein